MRKAEIRRKTTETNINIVLNIDGSGQTDITTGSRILDHMLSAFGKHALFDLTISATGDDIHHLSEDVAIVLGQAINQALGDKKGITRFAGASVPMDEALSEVIVDISGRPYCLVNAKFSENDMFGFPTDLVRHFLESLATEGRVTLHACIKYGENDHHKCESLFKALGIALSRAVVLDSRRLNQTPSTKGRLD